MKLWLLLLTKRDIPACATTTAGSCYKCFFYDVPTAPEELRHFEEVVDAVYRKISSAIRENKAKDPKWQDAPTPRAIPDPCPAPAASLREYAYFSPLLDDPNISRELSSETDLGQRKSIVACRCFGIVRLGETSTEDGRVESRACLVKTVPVQHIDSLTNSKDLVIAIVPCPLCGGIASCIHTNLRSRNVLAHV